MFGEAAMAEPWDGVGKAQLCLRFNMQKLVVNNFALGILVLSRSQQLLKTRFYHILHQAVPI
jgi:hypothetical protein